MKKILFLATFLIAGSIGYAQTKDNSKIVEASCGQCNFGLKDKKGCDLAVRIEGKAYFVTGTSIDKHGDAHAKDGFCNVVRKAKVTGDVIDNNFVATSFVLLPVEKNKQK